MKMNTSKILTLSALLAGSALNAASITWTAGTFDNAGPASVLNADNLVYAANLGGADLTVDVSGTNVLFEATPLGGAVTGEGVYVTNASGAQAFTDAYWTGGDANWDSINDTGIFRFSGTNALQVTLQGLTDGQEYQVQLFASDDTNSGNRSSFYSDAATAGNISSELRMGDKDYVVGAFIASGTTQDIFVQTGNIGVAYLDGLSLTTLTSIPEPGSYALIGGLLALGSVMLHRRR